MCNAYDSNYLTKIPCTLRVIILSICAFLFYSSFSNSFPNSTQYCATHNTCSIWLFFSSIRVCLIWNNYFFVLMAHLVSLSQTWNHILSSLRQPMYYFHKSIYFVLINKRHFISFIFLNNVHLYTRYAGIHRICRSSQAKSKPRSIVYSEVFLMKTNSSLYRDYILMAIFHLI